MPMFTTSDHVDIHYQDRGTGPTLVLLHSFATTGSVFDLQVLALAGHYRVITPDLRGCGRSDHPEYGNTVKRNARDITELLHSLGVEEAVLLGSSAGGNIALACALHSPELIAGVITVGAPLDALEGHHDHPLLLDLRENLRGNRPRAFARFAASQLGPRADAHLQDWLASLHMQCSPFADELLFDLTRDIISTRFVELTIPVVLFNGGLDASAPVAFAQSALHRLPRARLSVFEDCAHLPHLENPAEFNRRLHEALEDIWNDARQLSPAA